MLNKRFLIIGLLFINYNETKSMENQDNDDSIAHLFDTENALPLNQNTPIDIKDSNNSDSYEQSGETFFDDSHLQDSIPANGFTYSAKSIYVDKENKITYLHQLARLNREDCQSTIEKNLNLGCSLNDKNSYGQTPLHVAIIWGNLNFIQNLLKFCSNNNLYNDKLDLNIKDFNDNTGKTAFERCVDKLYLECNKTTDLEKFQNHADMLVMFLHIYNTSIDPNYFPLHRLVLQNKINFKKIKLVLDLVSVEYLNLKDEYGETIAHKAARYGHDDLLVYLIEHQANINLQNKIGRTPLHTAVLNNNFNIVDILAKNKSCDISLKDKNDKTALDYAVKNPLMFYTIVNEKELGYTETHKYAKYAKPGHINKLLNCQENLVETKSTVGKLTPLHVAAINNKKFAAQAIIQNISNNKEKNINHTILNLKDGLGNTPIKVAQICMSIDTSIQILSFIEEQYGKLLKDLEEDN